MQAYFLNQRWMVVHSPHMMPGKVVPGTKTRTPETLTFDGFWTGRGWTSNAAAAKTYISRQEAEDDLDKSQALMLGPL